MSRARLAFSRKRAPNRAEAPSSSMTASSISSGSSSTRSAPGGSSASGRCTMIPSSDQMASDSSPKRSRMRADRARPQAACTRPPNGESTHSLQSPISSRKRSTTIVRSLGTTRVAACCSPRYSIRLRAASSSRSKSRSSASGAWSTAQRANAPIACPSSRGRPTPSPRQNGTAPGTPGAGVTTTRSRPISSMRHDEAPSRKVCPGRAS